MIPDLFRTVHAAIRRFAADGRLVVSAADADRFHEQAGRSIAGLSATMDRRSVRLKDDRELVSDIVIAIAALGAATGPSWAREAADVSRRIREARIRIDGAGR